MKISVFGLLFIFGGQLFAQTAFDDYVKTKDSLNVVYFKQNRDSGQFDKNGVKTGLWTEYKLLIDSADNLIPVTVQGIDFKFELEFAKPTTLQKAEGTYEQGIVNGEWNWFEADYDRNKLAWRLSRKTKFKKGMKNGPEIEFGVFGEIQRKAKYTNDRLNGIETIYWGQDVIVAKLHWKNNVVQNASFFYQDGQLKMTQKLKGYSLWTIAEYHENGKLKANYQESGEGKEGEYHEYDEKGNLTITKYFQNGSAVEK
jgi:antitoxin component YwqK of YwqJK toxin-antitoxin module